MQKSQSNKCHGYHRDKHSSDILTCQPGKWAAHVDPMAKTTREIYQDLVVRSLMTFLGQTSRPGHGCIRINCGCKGKGFKAMSHKYA